MAKLRVMLVEGRGSAKGLEMVGRYKLSIGVLALVLLVGGTMRVASGTHLNTLQVVGRSPLLSRGMNSALTIYGNYVYVGSRTDSTHPNHGVLVVNRSDVANLKVVGRIPGEVGMSTRELRVWPEKGLLLVLSFRCSASSHACSSTSASAKVRFYDISGGNAASPRLVATYAPRRTPHEFYLWDDPNRAGRALLYMSTPSAAADNLLVADISRAREGAFREIGSWRAAMPDNGRDNKLHSLSLSVDGRRAYLAYLGGGFLVADTSDFAAGLAAPAVRLITPVANRVHWGDPGAHSAVKLFGRSWALTTDEVYGTVAGGVVGEGCPWGWARLINISDPARPSVAARYKIAQNYTSYCDTVEPLRDQKSSFASHNPTLTKNLAFITWHSGGLQAVSIQNPAAPAQVGRFYPTPLASVATEDPILTSGKDKIAMWSYPIVSNGLIYVVDIRNGLYVLKYTGPLAAEVAGIDFLEGNSNLGDATRLETGP